ncbi:cytidine deaminase-like protein [Linnemannia elongata]|nr:cytidine deaminase-like protein [Linnemannia elongata]
MHHCPSTHSPLTQSLTYFLLTGFLTCHLGCNVENASYGGAICAERTAFVKAVSEGHLRFVAIAVSCDFNHYITPCGICRQFMNEFGKNLEIFFVNDDRTYKRAVLADLLPYAFGPEDLPAK